MSLREIARRLFTKFAQSTAVPRPRNRSRLGVEEIEPRITPATFDVPVELD